MGYVVLALFFITVIFALIEDHIKKYNPYILLCLGIILVVLTATRPVGIDPDSINYEETFIHYDSPSFLDRVEFTYLFISRIVHWFSNDVHWLFFIYATLGVWLKFIAIRKMSSMWFLPLVTYLSYYYVQHECMQIRTGVLSGIMLLMIWCIGNHKRKEACMLLAIGTLFHYSALLLIPMFFLKNEEMTSKQVKIWALVIPVAYAIEIAGLTVFFDNIANLPFVGAKLAGYQSAVEKGTSQFGANVFSPMQILTILIYYYLLYFNKTINMFDKYFPIMLKVFGLGISAYVVLSFFPVIGERVTMLYKTVSILLYADIVYTMRPKWAATIIVMCIGIISLNYCLGNLGVILLWKV